MAEVEEEVIFHTEADQVQFHTQTNGDSIQLKRLKFTQGQATSMAWLVNAANAHLELEWQVKVKGT